MMVVPLKYVVFVMRADNDGEGSRRAFELLAETGVHCIINGAAEHNGGRTKSAGARINEAKPISLANSIPARLEDADTLAQRPLRFTASSAGLPHRADPSRRCFRRSFPSAGPLWRAAGRMTQGICRSP